MASFACVELRCFKYQCCDFIILFMKALSKVYRGEQLLSGSRPISTQINHQTTNFYAERNSQFPLNLNIILKLINIWTV